MADGYEIHGKNVRVYFRHEGKLYREVVGVATPENIDRAQKLSKIINLELECGTFDYVRHFPNGKQASKTTFGFYAALFMEIRQHRVAKSSFTGDRSKFNSIIFPRWESAQITDIDYIDIQTWLSTDVAHYHNKTLKCVISLMSQVFDLYGTRNKSHFNPTKGIKIRLPDDPDPDPFTLEEIDKLLTTDTDDIQMRDMIAFMIWDGCRPSEALALAWEDVESLNEGIIRYQRARVVSAYKVTKTKRSTRTHKLLKPAREALQRQFERTGSLPPVMVEIIERDNKTIRKKRIRPVFRKTDGDVITVDKSLRETFFKDHCEKAGVRYRPPSHCRHTFISQMLTLGVVPIHWIAAHVGHETIEMIQKRYGRWIQQDGPDIQATIEKILDL